MTMSAFPNAQIFAIGLVWLLVGCSATPTLSADEKPWFCHDLDCPSYKVINKTKTYEIREYKKTVWASSTIPGFIYSIALNTGFMRLFHYISGDNADQAKIDMTAPVLAEVVPGDGPFCRSNFTVSFFVPPQLADTVPEPTNPDVYISKLPAQRVFVLQFGGFLVDDFTLSSKASALTEAVKADGFEIIEDKFFTAGYDPPFRLTNRHNEIWVVEKPSSGGLSLPRGPDPLLA
eukprot:jgi/Botrbrau1/1060/Bobra.0076s0026.1